MRLYDTQSYAEAIAEFKLGYQLDPNPRFLFALGQAERQAGDCRNAIEAFRAYLRAKPPARSAAAANELIAECEHATAATRATAPVVPTDVPPPPALELAAPRPPPRRPRIATWVGVGLTLAAVITAGALEGVGASSYDDLRSSCAPLLHAGCSPSQVTGVRRTIDAANGMFISSGVLAAGTIIAAIVESRRARRR
jgi:hypothetical protein